jgi:hypothetical protein
MQLLIDATRATAVGLLLLLAACQTPPAPQAAPGAVETLADPDDIETVTWTSEPWRFGADVGLVIETPHHRLYTTVEDHYLIERLPLFLERSLAHYVSNLAQLPVPEGALETYLFSERSQWEAKTRQMLPAQAREFLALGRGGYTTRGVSVLYDIGRRDTLAIAAHEGWHQYTQRVVKSPLPIWLEEGIATYMEGYLSWPDGVARFRPWANPERYRALRDAVRRGRLIPLSELADQRPEAFLRDGKSRLLVYYAQVWALVHFLVEGEGGRYREGLEQVLLEAAAGGSARYRQATGDRLGTGLVAEYFDPDVAQFERRYLAFVERITRRGAHDRIRRGQSPLD